jgi:hypothetical protein
MFEKRDYYQDLVNFLDDEKIAKEFNINFKSVLTAAVERSTAEAINLLKSWDPTLPISEIRPILNKYFKKEMH